MRMIILLTATLFTWLLLQSCTKKNDINGGIGYGVTGVEPMMASSGDTIMLYGVGFSTNASGNTVSIHGADARVIAANSQSLQVIVPVAPGLGDIEVRTGSQSSSYTGQFVLATVITGRQNASAAWTADKLYVLENKVEFLKGTSLTVQAGTIILGDKDSLASLVIDDGATVSMKGTANNPIVFSSVAPSGLRYPGDWSGITLAASAAAGTDTISYVRIEYAGNHPENIPGAALEIDRSEPAGNMSYIQTSYSAGDGFRCNGNGTTIYLDHVLAFGDAGDDFSFEGNTRGIAQFLVGLKDPAYADALSADNLLVQSSQPVTISNLSAIGYDGLARNSINQPSVYYTLNDFVLNNNSGRDIHVGGVPRGTNGPAVPGTLQLFNSLVAAPWLAGISFDGPLAWAQYENGSAGSAVRNTTITYARCCGDVQTLFMPYCGYSLSIENIAYPGSGFEAIPATSQQYATFFGYNDSSQLELNVLYPSQPGIDNLGIKNMANYNNINGPGFVLATGSPLLTGADFSDTRLSDPFFDRTNPFTGAFGAADWTKGWTNFSPLLTPYQ